MRKVSLYLHFALALISTPLLSACDTPGATISHIQDSDGDFNICEIALPSDGGSVAYCIDTGREKWWVTFDKALESDHPCTFIVDQLEGRAQRVKKDSNEEKGLISAFSKWLTKNASKESIGAFGNQSLADFHNEESMHAYLVWHMLQSVKDRKNSAYCSTK
ncbi:hypothetical protein EUZ85_06170 [Hahella sp. KA22]|uniref:hypothetical protein n=1 Tax=Hahella sp. KA22 TaxID=1628392 RepID=UPI000FDEFC2A|nr:hypothetical protein [Hahella sp. KA22]AZZ90324.1 hypothetical protein ENC22_03615 [Hahella sp. KA22]QAY53695.1 hypothetical protein EUZ85_06170 [Hahella sp. KA22]